MLKGNFRFPGKCSKTVFMIEQEIIGIDLGGTQVRAALVRSKKVIQEVSFRIDGLGTVMDVVKDIFELVEQLITSNTMAIGIGVPSVVDIESGIVYDVQNIPSWKCVHLKELMETRFRIDVSVNNDSNCFALGEKHFGIGKNFSSLVGLTIGTGLGAGIIINDKLYTGANCGAGEFGLVDYLDKYYEYYACGQFFPNVYQVSGEDVYQKACLGEPQCLKLFSKFGSHLGNAIKMIIYTFDPQIIILGGSVRKAYPFFQEEMWNRIRTLVYSKSLEKFRLEISELENAGLLGAASLCFEH